MHKLIKAAISILALMFLFIIMKACNEYNNIAKVDNVKPYEMPITEENITEQKSIETNQTVIAPTPTPEPVATTTPAPIVTPAPTPVPVATPPAPVQESNSNKSFSCDGRQYCSEMTSCEEATYFLKNCPNQKTDGGDNDGIPCESQWCGGGY